MSQNVFEQESIVRVRIGRAGMDLDLWLRAWLGIQRVAVAILILVAHAAFKFTFALLFVQEFLGLQKLITVVFDVAVLSLNAWLLLEAVRIFLPQPYGIRLDSDGRDKGNDAGSSSNV